MRSASSCLERHADLVRRLADRAALLRRQLADRAQRRGQLRLAAEVAHPQLLELGACSPAARDRAPRPRLRSWSRSAIGGHPICHLVERHGRRHGDVERVGVHRDPRAPPRPSGSSPRSDPSTSTSGAVTSDLTQARARRARRGRPCGRRVASSVARAGGRAKIEPIDARTAFGEYGSAQPGPSTTVASASACAERMIVPDVARVLDAVEVDEQVARRARPSAACRRRSRGCRSRACSPRRAARAPRPRRPAARTPASRPARPGPRPRRRTGRASSASASAGACGSS